MRARGSDGNETNDDEEVLLRGFTISRMMDCIADPTKNRVIAEFWDEVGVVFPYLNAVLPNLMFNPGGPRPQQGKNASTP